MKSFYLLIAFEQVTREPYNFGYAIKDDYDDYGRHEESDGKVVTGSYHVVLPDGRKQIVKYRADPETGFTADVTYEGEAVYPEYIEPTQSPYKAKPAYVPKAKPEYRVRPTYEKEPEYTAAEPAYPRPAKPYVTSKQQSAYTRPSSFPVKATYSEPVAPPKPKPTYREPVNYAEPSYEAEPVYSRPSYPKPPVYKPEPKPHPTPEPITPDPVPETTTAEYKNTTTTEAPTTTTTTPTPTTTTTTTTEKAPSYLEPSYPEPSYPEPSYPEPPPSYYSRPGSPYRPVGYPEPAYPRPSYPEPVYQGRSPYPAEDRRPYPEPSFPVYRPIYHRQEQEGTQEYRPQYSQE